MYTKYFSTSIRLQSALQPPLQKSKAFNYNSRNKKVDNVVNDTIEFNYTFTITMQIE